MYCNLQRAQILEGERRSANNIPVVFCYRKGVSEIYNFVGTSHFVKALFNLNSQCLGELCPIFAKDCAPFVQLLLSYGCYCPNFHIVV